MGIQHVAASVAAAAATLIAAPAFSQDIQAPMTTFFVAIPLDATTHKEFTPNFGLQFQGSRAYQSVKVDYQTFKFLGGLEALELKYVVAGALAVGATVAVSHKNSNTQQSFQQQQQQQKEACPTQTC